MPRQHPLVVPVPIGTPQCCLWMAVKDTLFAAAVCKEKFTGTASCRRADHGKSCRHFRIGQQRLPQQPHSPSGEPSESPRHFAASMDESVIVGYGRMIEIYLVTSVAPIPMAAMMGKEWGGMGQNYLRSLLALGFQAFLIIVCVAIYAVLVQNIALEDDIIMAIWSCVGYTVLLCFTLFKTGSLAKSVFQAH